MRDNIVIWAMYSALVCFLLVFAAVANGQDILPVPVPVADVTVYEGPITEALERKLDVWFNQQKQNDTEAMQGILDRLRDNNVSSQEAMKSIKDWFKTREDQDNVRYQGLRGMLQKLIDREPSDTSALFPRINSMFSSFETRVEERQVQRWTPIVDRMNAFATAMIWLAIGFVVFILGICFSVGLLYRMVKRLIPDPLDMVLGK